MVLHNSILQPHAANCFQSVEGLGMTFSRNKLKASFGVQKINTVCPFWCWKWVQKEEHLGGCWRFLRLPVAAFVSPTWQVFVVIISGYCAIQEMRYFEKEPEVLRWYTSHGERVVRVDS